MIITKQDLQLLNKLMPFSPSEEDQEVEEGNLSYMGGLLVILDALPDVYMAGLLADRDGLDPNRIMLSMLNEKGFMLDCIAQTAYGVRIEARGSGFSRPDLMEEYSLDAWSGEYATAQRIWEQLGCSKGDWAYPSRRTVLSDLLDELIGPYKTRLFTGCSDELSDEERIGWFLAWVYSDTGEYYLDSLDEEVVENGFDSEWCTDEIEGALNIIKYRDTVWKIIMQGHELFLLHEQAIIEILKNEDVQECLAKLVSCLNCDASEPAPLFEVTETMVQ